MRQNVQRRYRLAGVVAAIALLCLTTATTLVWLFHSGAAQVPATTAGLVARHLCSGVFIAGRAPDDLWRQDLYPLSGWLRLIRADVDPDRKRVTASLPGLRSREAVFLPGFGCVLEPGPALRAQATAQAEAPAAGKAAARVPANDPPAATPPALAVAIDRHFEMATDTRALLVVQGGQRLAERYAPGFDATRPMPGWSITKSIIALLVARELARDGLPWETRAVDWVPAERQPLWLTAWARDARAAITIGDLLTMRDGLANDENYAPWGAVSGMLWSARDVAATAGEAPLAAPPGSRWRYQSASTNLLSGLLHARLGDDRRYTARLRDELLAPLGLEGLIVEPDARGQWIGSSFSWATAREFARLGQLWLDGGRTASGAALLSAADLQRLTTSAVPGYAAQLWKPADPGATFCRSATATATATAPAPAPASAPVPVPALPADALVMAGAFGQLVVAVPSRATVLVRLGWNLQESGWDRCRLIADLLAALPPPDETAGLDATSTRPSPWTSNATRSSW